MFGNTLEKTLISMAIIMAKIIYQETNKSIGLIDTNGKHQKRKTVRVLMLSYQIYDSKIEVSSQNDPLGDSHNNTDTNQDDKLISSNSTSSNS